MPSAEGGGGVGLADFFAFVEDRLLAEPAEQNRLWRKVLAGGAVVGGARSERGPAAFGETGTTLYQEAVFQLMLLAAPAGVGRAAHRDLVDTLQRRTRAYPRGLGAVPREDPQLQAVVGRVAAHAASHDAAVVVYEAQITITDDVFAATTLIYDGLGSSAWRAPRCWTGTGATPGP